MGDGEVNRKRKRGRGGKSRKKRSNEDSSDQKSPNPPPVNNRSVATADGNRNDGKKKSQLSSRSSSLLDKMRAKLSGGHFRMLNEKLYTCTGKEALRYFSDDPSLFNVYHAGYQEQMLHWPEQPVNIIMKWLKNKSPSLVVADFGCGDARLAKNVKNKVYSFDLVANDPSVIACDMSNTPLESSSIDVAVFCLSLMGVNYQSFIQEANRVLKPGGWLLIAEVKSRFDPNTKGADPKVFIKAVCKLGFTSELKE
uniref:Ribosomal RNA-processing protein 8 n=1 Tax=Kalanchoe fedtschenkoi TaxID=63787 RepID=A0A7N0U9F4_KALFE